MIGVLALSAVDPGFEPLSSQTKNYKNCICCFYTELWIRAKTCQAMNQDNVSEWSDMSTHWMLYQ